MIWAIVSCQSCFCWLYRASPSSAAKYNLPIHRMLNSLAGYLIFDVQTACSLYCKHVCSLTSPLPPSSSFLRAANTMSPRLGVLNIPPRWLSTFRVWLYLFSSVSQSVSHVHLFATPWTAACHASLSIINSPSLLKLKLIESVMPSNHLILWLYFWSTPAGTWIWISTSTFHAFTKATVSRWQPRLMCPIIPWVWIISTC